MNQKECPLALKRHIELYDARGEPYVVCDGKIFRPYREAVRPYGPIKLDHTLTREKALKVLRELGRTIMLCTDGIYEQRVSDWYAVVCDRFIPLGEYKAKQRSELKRGLLNCEVRRIEADYAISDRYEVYTKAFRRYRGMPQPFWGKEEFRAYMKISEEFEDIVHFWGVFCHKKLVAFAINNIFDKVEATYWLIKIDPDYLRYYPVYALLYRMNEYYLAEQGFEYVNDGWRSIVHNTGIQDFLIKKFGFKKKYSRLQVTYRRWLAPAVRFGFPIRLQLGKLDSRVRTLFMIEELGRSSLNQGED
jgi:hypothetical protein